MGILYSVGYTSVTFCVHPLRVALSGLMGTWGALVPVVITTGYYIKALRAKNNLPSLVVCHAVAITPFYGIRRKKQGPGFGKPGPWGDTPFLYCYFGLP